MRAILVWACVLGACGDDAVSGDVEVRVETADEVAVEATDTVDEVDDVDAVEATEEVAADTVEEAEVIEVRPLEPELAERLPSNVDEGFTLHRLGAKATLDGETEDFTFDVPEGAVTLHVSLVTTKGSMVALLGAVSPEGTWVLFDEAPDGADMTAADALASGFGGGLLSPNKTVPLPQATTTLIPNSPRVALTPGRWTFRAGSFKPVYDADEARWDRSPIERDIEVAMLVRTKPVPTTGTVDLVLSFDAPSGLTAATAQDDVDIAASIDILAGALDAVGIAIGEITYRDITLSNSNLPLSQPDCNLDESFAAVFDEAPAPSPDVVHVIFVQHFTCPKFGGAIDYGDNLAALSIGAPGTPFATRSGILASTFAKPTYPVEWAEVLAHEVGHYLGLFHTSETSGGIVDNIADTADDEAGAAANIMYFNVTLSTATTLTPDQGKIVRSSPLVR